MSAYVTTFPMLNSERARRNLALTMAAATCVSVCASGVWWVIWMHSPEQRSNDSATQRLLAASPSVYLAAFSLALGISQCYRTRSLTGGARLIIVAVAMTIVVFSSGLLSERAQSLAQMAALALAVSAVVWEFVPVVTNSRERRRKLTGGSLI